MVSCRIPNLQQASIIILRYSTQIVQIDVLSKVHIMESAKNMNNIITCAACGKEDSGDAILKSCTACKSVKYCNRDCQIAHRPQHKKACKKRAIELQKLYSKIPARQTSAQSAFYPYQTYLNKTSLNHAAGKLCAMVVFMQ